MTLTKYKLAFNKHYLKDLEKIPSRFQKQIQASFALLSENPRPEGCKKLKGTKEPLYRIRSGDYRIVYTIKDDLLIVLAVAVGHRKDVYR